jgi:hypothetical protein
MLATYIKKIPRYVTCLDRKGRVFMKKILRYSLFTVALATSGAASAAQFSLSTSSGSPTPLAGGDSGVTGALNFGSSIDQSFYFTPTGLTAGASGGVFTLLGSSLLAVGLIDVSASNKIIVDLTSGLQNFVLPSIISGDEYKFEVKGSNPFPSVSLGTIIVGQTPLPAAAWLLLSGLAGVGAMSRRRSAAA